jgi:hypothetical protein
MGVSNAFSNVHDDGRWPGGEQTAGRKSAHFVAREAGATEGVHQRVLGFQNRRWVTSVIWLSSPI